MKLRNGKTYNINEKKININSTTKNLVKDIFVSCDKLKNILLEEKKINDKKKIVKKPSKPVLNIDKYKDCCICYGKYKLGDIICSCDISNINKHSFHKKCLKQALVNFNSHENGYPGNKCPFCLTTIIYKEIKYIKIV